MDRGLDYSWGRPRLDQVLAADLRFVVRYLSSDATGKTLTAAERDRIRAAGLELALVWEERAGDPRGGAPLGRRHGAAALVQAQALGYPAGATVYVALDEDYGAAELDDAVGAYTRAAAQQLREGGYRMGVYGGVRPVAWALDSGAADDGWQTYAWSRGRWDPRAALRQVLNGQQFAGATVDFNERHGATSFWAPCVLPQHPAGSRVLRPASPMMKGSDVALVQARIGEERTGPADGVYGPRTAAGVRWYQGANGLRADGVVGPQTWGHLLG